MKQILLKMTLAIAGLLMSINVFAAGFTAENGLAYTILETGDGSNAVEVTYTNSKGGSYTGDIVVPAEVTNESVTYKVTGIGAKAFYKCTGMTSVVLPEGLKNIAKEAFYGCNAITTITIPSTVTEILSYAFYNCKALTAVVIPDGVEVINTYTFNNCIKMTSLTIGAGVKEINSSAFKYCESLPSVTIPKNVAKIAGDAFGSCKSLKEFVVDSENASYCAIDKILYSKDGTTAIMCPIALEGAITIPAGTTTIDVEAFSGCTKITSVTVPSSVTAINEGAFDGCSALTTATLNEGLLTIGESVFDNAGLTSIVVPNSVTSIGANAFYYCMALETAQIGSGVTTIGASPFYRCTALKSINVDAANANFTSVDGVLYSKDKTTLLAYPNKKAATYEIIDGVTTIGDYAFCYCTDVTAVTMPNTVTTLNKEAFSNCEALATLNFSTALQTIGEKAFYYCEALKEVKLPEGLIYIGEMAFNKATTITEVVIPNSVTTLDEKAFQNCSALADVTIGSGVEEVGSSAFNGCSAVAHINILRKATPKTGSGAFNKVPSTVCVTMPTASIEDYKGVTAWNNLIKNKPALAVTVEGENKVYYSASKDVITGAKHIVGDSTSLFIPSGEPLTITLELAEDCEIKYNDSIIELDANNAFAIDEFNEDATFAVAKKEVVEETGENYPDPVGTELPEVALTDSHDMISVGTTEIAELAGKTVRRTIVKGENMYVLALDAEKAPYIYVINVTDNSVVAVSTEGAVAPTDANGLMISDIAVSADNKLVATNYDWVPFNSTVYNFIYTWANDENGIPTGNPTEWAKSNGAARCSNGMVGSSIAFSGTLNNGTAMVAVNHLSNGAISGKMRFIRYTKEAGEMVIADANQGGATQGYGNLSTIYHTIYGSEYKFTVSPVNEANFIFDGNLAGATEFSYEGLDSYGNDFTVVAADAVAAKDAVNSSYFKYAGSALMAVPTIVDGACTGIQLLDVTEGLDKATEVKTLIPAISGETTALAEIHAAGRSFVDGTEGKIDLFLLIGNKLVKYTSGTPAPVTFTPATGSANPFAFDLKGEVVDGIFKASFSLNAEATAVTVNILDAEGAVVATANGATAKGAQTVDINVAELADATYTWEVEVAGAEKTTMEEFAQPRFYHPRGVDVDNNMESDAFGYVYVTEGMSTTSTTYYPASRGGVGLFIFDPLMNGVKNEKTDQYAFMSDLTYTFISYGADLARVRVAEDGRIFVTRCNNAGDYILYAPNHEDLVKNNKFHSLLAGGSVDASTYLYNTADGFLAGPNIGLDIKGAGEDLKMMTVIADQKVFAFNATGSRVDEYALGTAEVLPTPTNVPALSGYTIAPQVTNVEYDNEGGVWYCQYRGAPNNSEPALIYVDANGEVKYFEGDGGVVRGGGGIRISPDGTQIAIASSKKTFSIYDIKRNADGTIKLAERTIVNHGIGTNCYDIAWDLAGNIYICGNSGEYMKGFALPREAKSFTTSAPSKQAFTLDSSAIEEIGEDNAPAEYYNLQGIKVENPEKGIFIKKQGNKATKVVL